MKNKSKILETIQLSNGFEIDMEEGWSKLISSQFGGSPGRAFSEFIQNAIDSYPSTIPFNQRKGAITSTCNSISITDWGEGLDAKRLSLLATAGGTDKTDDKSKIGKFGLGFISIFNPKLGTKRVVVITKCEGHTVEMTFNVVDYKKCPEISLRIIEKPIDYSTCITVEFSNSDAVSECLNFARKSLTYYPCSMTIDGQLFKSKWHNDLSDNSLKFSEKECEGIISGKDQWVEVTILCKYELVMESKLSHFITGGHNMKHNLVDYDRNGTPFIPQINILININNLSLVISRDSYYLDEKYRDARSILNKKLKYFLYLALDKQNNREVVIANQYIFRKEICHFINNQGDNMYMKDENRLIKLLASLPVYRINGRPDYFSLIQLKGLLSKKRPMYYSVEKSNLRWLGGNFKHDFILIPESPGFIVTDVPHLYDGIFETIFKDVVNLDTVRSNTPKITELVDRGIIDKSSLSPECQIVGVKDLSGKQKETIEKLSKLLNDPTIQNVISHNLQLPISSIKPSFFTLKKEGVYLSTGIFNSDGKPISTEFKSNFLQKKETPENGFLTRKKQDIILGLNMNHPFVSFLVESNDQQKEYFTLTYLAHELAMCQKMLVPYSPFFHLVKEKLTSDMRKVLSDNMLASFKN